MRIDRPTPLLGGLSPQVFMRRHWQRKPLLVRAALPDALPDLDARRLFALAAREDVESRLIVEKGGRWSVRPGPVARRALPAASAGARWTVLVQGVDLHDASARRLLEHFRFVPDARLDDVMLSVANDGGGVGPHVDSYDVFLLQIEGRRRWRIGRPSSSRLRIDVPLKMLAGFEAEEEWLLDPGDMLYLPPDWAHEGVADGPCITASIGFRAPDSRGIASDTLQRLLEAAAEDDEVESSPDGVEPATATAAARRARRYADPMQPAAARPARIPAAMQRFADAAVARFLADRRGRERALGEVLSEPKAGIAFESNAEIVDGFGAALDRRTRMLYDSRHVYINGESYHADGIDARLMRRLADARRLDAAGVARLGPEARSLLDQWAADGWCAPWRPSGQE